MLLLSLPVVIIVNAVILIVAVILIIAVALIVLVVMLLAAAVAAAVLAAAAAALAAFAAVLALPAVLGVVNVVGAANTKVTRTVESPRPTIPFPPTVRITCMSETRTAHPEHNTSAKLFPFYIVRITHRGQERCVEGNTRPPITFSRKHDPRVQDKLQ